MGAMEPAVLSKNVILVNGSDAIGGAEGDGRLVYHEPWKLYLMYVSGRGGCYYSGQVAVLLLVPKWSTWAPYMAVHLRRLAG
jgi:hypothetical protein